MEKREKNKVNNLGWDLIAKIGLMSARYTANTACTYILHQPEVPKGIKKLRKF